MGVLTVATPKKWADSLQYFKYVKEHGLQQFLKHYKKSEDFNRNELMYGDELEYGIFVLDPETETVKLSLRSAKLIECLQAKETEEQEGSEFGKCKWVPEYGSFMIEAIPAAPYGGFTSDLRRIEANMRNRRARLLSVLGPNEIAPTVVVFPLMGVGNFAGDFPVRGKYANSRFIPDEVINPHPRFWTLTQNIRERRGSTVKIMVPLFNDTNTDHTPEEGADGSAGIYMDAMAFGMGCCCLQVTFQARDVSESRHLYDQLGVIAPILLALTAATPIHKGKLADWDARWNIICDSVDCRTEAERGVPVTDESVYHDEMAGKGKRKIETSRYSGIDCFICNHKGGCDPHSSTKKYNDKKVVIDEEAKETLEKAGMDELISQHLAHLFVRDPLVTFDEHIEIDDETRTDHFENIQSTNWNSVRWKPPPAKEANSPHIGWRTELRTMEVQLTDYENAAFSVFAVLLSRALLSFDLNLYIPITKVDENMERAHQRESVTKEKFWFRSHLAPPDDHECTKGSDPCRIHSEHDLVEEMTVTEILTGKGTYFPGLIHLIMAYVDSVGCDSETMEKISNYLELIRKRATGELMTPATWMRQFVTKHADYKNDSIVSQKIAYDLMVACNQIGLGRMPCPDVLGDVRITEIVKENAYNIQLSRVNLGSRTEVNRVLQRYAERAARKQRKITIIKEMEQLQKSLTTLADELVDLDDQEATSETVGFERKRLDSESIRVETKSSKK
eukprot:m.101126 g.101126  ORF g.101126 m.101126 type:complete len:733 (-) comp27304_c0_seq3:222-2420(-)